MKTLVAVFLVIFSPAVYAADMITKPSIHSVDETINRLAVVAEAAGATIFAKVDHAKGAASVGGELRPTMMLMFGNPKLGTPAMQAAQTAGLDLPLRVLAYETESGDVMVTYHDPAAMAAAHGIPADAEVIKLMTGALNKLTDAAVNE